MNMSPGELKKQIVNAFDVSAAICCLTSKEKILKELETSDTDICVSTRVTNGKTFVTVNISTTVEIL